MTDARFMTDGMESDGARAARIARGWIGTPYRHQGSSRIGCDCLGLIRGVWRELRGAEPEEPGPYGRDWAERSGEERLLEAARRHFGAEISGRGLDIGDVLVFRLRRGVSAQHLGIVSADGRFIHAYEQTGVVESPLAPAWRRRIAAVFRF
ncbi:NlpC/P60 family protein [Rhizobium sp. FKL33]|uniref:NlpC/P60 family protein n=1 Tax=Rhizobium sp. FKL33 TaxID=2562307 RepID=UPI001FEDD487|nr:NlpC/P60 family protein [Rhizobium sp. FKL33]